MKEKVIILIYLVIALILASLANYFFLGPPTVPTTDLVVSSPFVETSESSPQDPDIQRIGGNSYYYKNTKTGEIYYSSSQSQHVTLSDADQNSFSTPFSTSTFFLGRDKDHIYVEGRKDISVDPNSFTIYNLESPYGKDRFFRDKNGFYFLEVTEKGQLALVQIPFDPRSAKFENQYIKTATDIYSYGGRIVKIEGVDPATFHYVGPCMIVETSGASFTADKNHVYVDSQIIPDMDPNTLTQIAKMTSDASEVPFTLYLWKDKNHIYAHCGRIITEADYATFRYVGGMKAEDKNNTYGFNTGGNYVVMPKNK